MSSERFFLDTAYILALLNARDHYHETARAFFPRMRTAQEVWVTEAILIEVGNILARSNRAEAAAFIRTCETTSNIRIVPVDTALFGRALALYEQRSDKTWGLTDCLSFVVMQDHGLSDALTADDHFRQAGFRVLLETTES